MIRNLLTSFALILALAFSATGARADAQVGKPAPDFTAVDSQGQTRSLNDKEFAGKIIVLEWLNFNCPFVKKHYGAGNMQKLQKDAKAEDVIWLSVASASKSKKDFMDGKALEAQREKLGGKQTAILIDSDGKIGKAYGAKNTPEMFVIDSKHVVAYVGAIDSIDSAEAEDIAKAKNYVAAAIADLKDPKKNGKVAVSETKPYGCGVKY